VADGVDYAALAAGVEQMREVVNAAVAGLREDGFTDREARALTVALLTNGNYPEKEDGGGA
jgi:predicted DNA binding protein